MAEKAADRFYLRMCDHERIDEETTRSIAFFRRNPDRNIRARGPDEFRRAIEGRCALVFEEPEDGLNPGEICATRFLFERSALHRIYEAGASLTAPHCRGRGLQYLGLLFGLANLAALEPDTVLHPDWRLVSIIAADNMASRANVEKAGFLSQPMPREVARALDRTEEDLRQAGKVFYVFPLEALVPAVRQLQTYFRNGFLIERPEKPTVQLELTSSASHFLEETFYTELLAVLGGRHEP